MTLIDLGRAVVDADEIAAIHFAGYSLTKVLLKDGRSFTIGEHQQDVTNRLGDLVRKIEVEHE